MTNFDAYQLTAAPPNHLSFGGLDRDSLTREGKAHPFDYLQSCMEQALILPIWQLKNLFKGPVGPDHHPKPVFVPAEQMAQTITKERPLIYLGKRQIGITDSPIFVLDLSDMDEDNARQIGGPDAHFAELREVGPMIDGADGSVLAYARAMIYWNNRHLFCGKCGSPTVLVKLGHQRSCCDSACGELHFPRTDPAVIMLVQNGGHILLGRQAIWPQGMYSTLAGFVEPGETIEHATAREVFEEVGIKIGQISYQHSQPWPFPSSLMLGMRAHALTTELKINTDEIEHAQWFSKEELLNFDKQDKFLPRKLSISRRLIDDWLAEQDR